jgi:hypothetical protein
MPTDGATKLHVSNGKRFLRADGSAMVFENEQPCACTVASFITNGSDPNRSCWNLSVITGGFCCRGSRWRLVETCANIVYSGGTVVNDCCAEKLSDLTGLPTSFCTPYLYDGCMELQVGGPECGGQWPPGNSNSNCECPTTAAAK